MDKSHHFFVISVNTIHLYHDEDRITKITTSDKPEASFLTPKWD